MINFLQTHLAFEFLFWFRRTIAEFRRFCCTKLARQNEILINSDICSPFFRPSVHQTKTIKLMWQPSKYCPYYRPGDHHHLYYSFEYWIETFTSAIGVIHREQLIAAIADLIWVGGVGRANPSSDWSQSAWQSMTSSNGNGRIRRARAVKAEKIAGQWMDAVTWRKINSNHVIVTHCSHRSIVT